MKQKSTLASTLEVMLRVNHAGEYGARLIYETQIACLQKRLPADHPIFETLAHMAAQEKEHLAYFTQQMVLTGVRPSFFQPLWYGGAKLLGACTALWGEKAVHACTMAVEDVIEAHYQSQIDTLNALEMSQETTGKMPEKFPENFKETLQRFKDEECEHRQTATDLGGGAAPGFTFLYNAVKAISKTAIWIVSKE